ncbi:MmpS family transport accessory protein [Mycobacterium talmoniae]|uniref:MmpS family transport accessory protein n=1 Tax=Mycobacterium talmoniae TaxID=1858794 RepID=UPI0009F52F83|nr:MULTISPECIES: MmpS family transport accessory protein [Mycobacterium]TDH50665.1 transporter [Mycobacterium eburneum]
MQRQRARWWTRAWVPLVVLAIIASAGYAVFRLHGIFGSHNINAAVGDKDDSTNIIPKDVVYEVFGPPGTTGQVHYLDERAQPQRADFRDLPWSFTISTTLPTVFASVVAQGDSATLGCRITVNGAVRDEHSVHTEDAETFCLVKAA